MSIKMLSTLCVVAVLGCLAHQVAGDCKSGLPKDRVDCGYGGIPAEECLAKGCCFDNSIPDVIWCFKDPSPDISSTTLAAPTTTTVAPCNGVNRPKYGNIANGKPTTQSIDNFAGFASSQAVDGDTATASCTWADSGTLGWWQVDLGQPTRIDHVEITLWDDDAYPLRRTKFVIGLSNSSVAGTAPTWKNFPALCFNYADLGDYGKRINVACPLNVPLARYVIIQSESNVLCLMEVEVYVATRILPAVNVALQKPALLVATNGTYTADKAVDGLPTTTACAPSSSIRPWFQVDLGAPKFVDSVRITGTAPSDFPNRMRYLIVSLSNVSAATTPPNYLQHQYQCEMGPSDVTNGYQMSIQCPFTFPKARYVILHGNASGICLMEVEVYEGQQPANLVNVAKGKTATQMSTSSTGAEPASNANDADRVSKSCTVFKDNTNHWWQVDLGTPTVVDFVTVTRDDFILNIIELMNFAVGLSNTSASVVTPVYMNYPALCGQYPSNPNFGDTSFVYCGANVPPARYVIVQGVRPLLCMRAVEVYSRC